MKALLIPLLALLASCGTTHKVVNTVKKTVDSSVTVTHDTSHVIHEEESGDMFHLHDVHIRVEYPADTALTRAKEQGADTVAWEPYYVPRKASTKAAQIAEAIKEAITASGGAGRLPSSITIDIGSLLDSSGHSTRTDSGSEHATSQTDLHKTEAAKTKDITHTGISLGLKIGLVFLLLIVLAVAAWRLYQKFKP